MKTKKLFIAVASAFLGMSAAAYAAGPQSIKVVFDGTDNANWKASAGTYSENNGAMDVTMTLQSNGKYRSDLQFQTKDVYTIDTSKDIVWAIKLVGDIPGTSNAKKFEFNYQNNENKEAWVNGINNPSGSITTNNGKIYYFNVGADGYNKIKDMKVTDPAIVKINKIHFIMADATGLENGADYVYTVDWVATFESVEELQKYANWADDGSGDTHDGNLVADLDIPTAFKTLNEAVAAVPEMTSADDTKDYYIYANGDATITSRTEVTSRRVILQNNTDGEVVIKSSVNSSTLSILTQRNSNNYNSYFKVEGITFDGNNQVRTQAFYEAGNYCKSHLFNCKFQNIVSSQGTGAVISNKNGGEIILENVVFNNCKATNDTKPAVVFAGTDNINLWGNIEFHDIIGNEIYLEKHFLRVKDLTFTTPLKVYYQEPAVDNIFLSCPWGQNKKFYKYFDIQNPGWRHEAPEGNYTDTKLKAAPTASLSASCPWATFCVDYISSVPQGVDAYKATSTSGGTVYFQKINGDIPANTGVLLFADGLAADKTVTLPTAAAADAIEGNILVGTTAETTTPANCYVMSKSQSTTNAQLTFGKYTGASLPANKAYFIAESAPAKLTAFFGDEGETTGIDTMTEAHPAANNRTYNIMGQRVATNAKGIVIINGKKYFNK